jgi:type II secretory ATPase GspE/PulE/Tfp pilus assembly ATPase PilB-like protein
VEYQLNIVNQTQINPKAGYTFAGGLRAILRQDPDIVMVGEIRDTETGDIAIRAALTGHLVLSTLHTNDSCGAVSRLTDMGIEPFLISAALTGVMAQRLVRRICSNCKRQYNPPAEMRDRLGLGDEDMDHDFYVGTGCRECKNTGYKGRVGIYELLVVDKKTRRLIISRAEKDTIKKVALENGMTTLRQNGLDKVFQGMTTLEEVLRVASKDE